MKDAYDPGELIRNPPKPADVTLELLLASQTHLGHSTQRWNPQNSRYIFGIRDGVHIISLDVTAAHLRRAAKVVEEVAARGGLILFTGTREGQKNIVVRAAKLARGYHIFERWIPGSLSNGQQILGHCATKIVNALDEELREFRPALEDRPALKPDLVICLNPVENEVMLHECGLHNVPTIGVIDTDATPTRVTYPIPANDDSLRSVGLIAGVLGRAGEAGQERRFKEARTGRFTYPPVNVNDLSFVPTSVAPPSKEYDFATPAGALSGPQGENASAQPVEEKVEATTANADVNADSAPSEAKAADANAEAKDAKPDASAKAEDITKGTEPPNNQ